MTSQKETGPLPQLLAPAGQRLDTRSQGQKRFVDVGSLSQPLTWMGSGGKQKVMYFIIEIILFGTNVLDRRLFLQLPNIGTGVEFWSPIENFRIPLMFAINNTP